MVVVVVEEEEEEEEEKVSVHVIYVIYVSDSFSFLPEPLIRTSS